MGLSVSVETGKISRGFTLIELLVVVSIVGVTMAIALPSITKARSSQRRSLCANNQHLIGLAFLQFVDATNVFPNAATYGEIPGVKTAAAVNKSIINYAFLNNSANFGTFIPANPAKGLLTDIGPLHSWVVDLLPYLDAQSLYNDYNRSRVYWDNGRTGDDPSRPTNLTIASTSLPSPLLPGGHDLAQGRGEPLLRGQWGFLALAWHSLRLDRQPDWRRDRQHT